MSTHLIFVVVAGLLGFLLGHVIGVHRGRRAADGGCVSPAAYCPHCDQPFMSIPDAIEHGLDVHNAPSRDDAKTILELNP